MKTNEILKLSISLLNSKNEETIKEIYGNNLKIAEILYHLIENSSNKNDITNIANDILNPNYNCSYLSFCIDFKSKEQTLSIDIEKIIINDEQIPNAYTENSLFPLIVIFPEDYFELEKYIKENISELEYNDNLRICIKGDKEGEILYQKAKDNGCCGFFDKEIKIGNNTYKIGCNYGH